ncbi:hypothetical protein AO354_46450 [Pseudomonas syringae pv. syringae]|nr:hypothetical protein AO354_46450 [Pseudomonas syringae pv. syringae]
MEKEAFLQLLAAEGFGTIVEVERKCLVNMAYGTWWEESDEAGISAWIHVMSDVQERPCSNILTSTH